MFRRLAKTMLLVVAGCLIAGVYGAVHDQISYSVSYEYFTCFKFIQFSIPEQFQNRLGASIVGWAATWWMGIFIGIFIIPAGMMICRDGNYFKRIFETFAVVAITAFIIGIGALLISFLTVDQNHLPNFLYPDSVTDKVSFARVGIMHNFSYLGGVIGIVTGIIYLIIRRIRGTDDIKVLKVDE